MSDKVLEATVLPASSNGTHHRFNGQIETFVASILDDAVETHEVIFAADCAAAIGKPVQLPLENL